MISRVFAIAGLCAALLVPLAPARSAAAPCSAGHVSLTFDSGPNAPVTAPLLDLLKARRVKATFFVLGRQVAAEPELARRIAAEGHVVANHSWTHRDFESLTDDEIREEITSTDGALRSAGVRPIRVVRPPSGRTDPRVDRVIRGLGFVSVNWTVSSHDWEDRPALAIIDSVIRNLHPSWTNTVLLHDGNARSAVTLKTVPAIIDRAKALGYCFTTLGSDGKPADAVPVVRATTTTGYERRRVPVRVSLALDRPTSRAVRVVVSTIGGSARARKDFRPVRRSVLFRAGSTRQTITVPVVDDHRRERREWLSVRLAGDSTTRLATRSVSASIVSDDR